MKETKAWAFLVGEKGKEYLVGTIAGEVVIYHKKPLPRPHPFFYGRKRGDWKPTRITITW